MTIERFAGLLLLAALGSPLTADTLPPRDDYGYRFALTPAGTADFYQVELSPAVYQSVADPLLRDAGVYNAAGRAVPRRFNHPDEARGPEQRTPLGLAPLYSEADLHSDPARLRLRLDAAGTRLELGTDHGGVPAERQRVIAYLIDMRALAAPPEQLELEWRQGKRGLLAAVTVQQSNDLRHWRDIGSATLADIDQGGTRIEQRRIELTAEARDFLRILWRNAPADWQLGSVTGVRSGGSSARRDWLTLQPSTADAEAGSYQFDAGGYAPVDRVGLLLPDSNSMVRASVSCRADASSAWQPAHAGVFFALSSQGGSLHGSPATIAPCRAREWRVRIDSGVPSGPIQLQLGWRPDQLTFLAQGEGPFELVTGRARDRLEHFPQQARLGDDAIFTVLEQAGQAGEAALGPRQQLAGPQALTTRAMSWYTLLLWAGLGGAVLLAGRMVYSLLRELPSR